MHPDDCQLLNDYLAEQLEGVAFERFEAHLTHCAACRGEIDLQRAIDRELVSGNNAITPPAALIDCVERQTKRSSRRPVWGICAAAAVLLLIAGASILGVKRWWETETGDSAMADKLAQRPLSGDRTRRDADAAPPERTVQVTFPANQEIIVAEQTTDDPTVSIFMVYSAYQPPNRED